MTDDFVIGIGFDIALVVIITATIFVLVAIAIFVVLALAVTMSRTTLPQSSLTQDLRSCRLKAAAEQPDAGHS